MGELGRRRYAVPLQWHVNHLQLTGLSWGDPGEKPLFALHGWLDNAASFSFLAPLLTGFHVVALDLTGHGLSAHRSADASYQIWDDLPEILGVLDALGWDTFDLVGHSRGAIIATLLASAFPERVRSLVLLDAVSPEAVPEDNFPLQMRKALQDKSRLLGRANRVFASVDEAIASRDARGLTSQAVDSLVRRNLRESANGVTWTTDQRLRGASQVKLSEGQIRAVLHALHMPTLLLLAEDSTYQPRQLAEFALGHIERLTVQTIKGGHHFHMGSNASEVAQRLKEFLAGTEESRCA